MKEISIITVTYNSGTVIQKFMECLLRQTAVNFLVYVIDNNSKDNTIRVLAGFHDSRIKCIMLNENVGFAAGSNIGIKMALDAGSDYVMLLNNDTEFNEFLLETLLFELESQQLDAVTPKIMYFDQPNKIWYAGGKFKKYFEFIIIHNGYGENDIGQYDTSILCSYAPMCCVLFKRDCFIKNGYLDENFFVYSEDADWFYRARQNGIKLLYVPKVILYHKVSSLTGGSDSSFSIWHGTRNKVYLIKKNFNGVVRLLYLLEYLGWIIIGAILRKFTFKEFKLKIKAFFNGLFFNLK